mmetsp:Transcript_16994/g.29993  ORF Transcript_16994/g.29993 Transcript_16994/m.29993 type:complete len:469 (-) Transcript_16994:154-1560(-)
MKISPQLFVFAATLPGSAQGCSRVLQNKFDTIVAGRSMDWGFSFEDILFLNPPGLEMDGGAGDLSVEWTSKYGSITSSIIPFFAGYGDAAKEYGTGIGPGEGCEGLTFEKDGSVDGVNTEGLAVHVLELGEQHGTQYAQPSAADPVNISFMRWSRYVLDNFATVAEAVEGLKTLTTIDERMCNGIVGPDGQTGVHLGAHMAMEDTTGDSAIIEHVDGEMQIYHSRTDALVMTNDPPFVQQKELLAKYDLWGGDIKLPENLPGTVDSRDRFVRLEYYLQYTPEPANYAEAIANIRTLISNTNVPFGAPYGGGIYPTWWTSFVDVTDKIYFFDWLLTPNMVWVDLQEIEWGSVPGILMLKPQDIDLVGNVLCEFTTLDGEDSTLDGCAETSPNLTDEVHCFSDPDRDGVNTIWPVCSGKEEEEFCDGDGDCDGTNFCNCDVGQSFCSTGVNPCVSTASVGHVGLRGVAME